MWRIALSRPLPVVALVGHYPTNKLIGHGSIPDRLTFAHKTMRFYEIIRYYRHFRKESKLSSLFLSPGHVTHAFLTRSPLDWNSVTQKPVSFDLHALATPPAFVLSQDQTLQLKSFPRHHPEGRSRLDTKKGATFAYWRS